MKHIHSTAAPFRTQATIRRLLNEPGLPMARHLGTDRILDACRAVGYAFRERLFNPAITLWMFLTQMLDPDHSCDKAVKRFLAFRCALGLRRCSSKNSGYCKARKRLPERVVSDLTRSTGQTLADQAFPAWLLKGRPVKIVDGTGLSMPGKTQRGQLSYFWLLLVPLAPDRPGGKDAEEKPGVSPVN
jgi:hypothetical protein